MIYFLFGPDTYRSRQKARELTDAFDAKYGSVGPARLVDAEIEPEAASDVGRGASLFSKKEFWLVKNALLAPEPLRRYFESALARWKDERDFTIVFWEGEVAKGRDTLAAAIQKHAAKAQEFKLLESVTVRAWISREAERRGIRLASGVAEALAATYGPDLWAISNQLGKIAAGAAFEAPEEGARKIWDLTDAFLDRPRRAFRPLEDLFEQGEDPIGLVAALGSAVRSLALVAGAVAKKSKRGLEKMHPFVIRKYSALAAKLPAGAIPRMADAVLGADLEMKTSRLPAAVSLLRLTLDERKAPTRALKRSG